MRWFSKKVRNTIFACTIKLMFPRYLFFIFFKIIKKNFMVFKKICNVYPTVQQFCSNAHQLVEIFIIISCLLFYSTLPVYPIFKSTDKFFSPINLSCLYAFHAVDIQPPNKTFFFRFIFSSSFIHFEKVFR